MSRILVVDDEPEVAGMLAQALAQRGHECQTVRTAFRAVQALKGGQFDAVLLDVHLGGGVSGMELAFKVRALSSTMKILIFSAVHHGPDIERQILALKASFFEKPVTAARIIEALDDSACS